MSAQAIKFKNFTNEDFTWSWDGIPYTFKAGEEIYLEDYKAKHFAKHLIDRECNKQNIPTDRPKDEGKKIALHPKIKEMEKLCFPSEQAVTTDAAIDINVREEIKKKKGKKKVEEEEFADLKN